MWPREWQLSHTAVILLLLLLRCSCSIQCYEHTYVVYFVAPSGLSTIRNVLTKQRNPTYLLSSYRYQTLFSLDLFWCAYSEKAECACFDRFLLLEGRPGPILYARICAYKKYPLATCAAAIVTAAALLLAAEDMTTVRGVFYNNGVHRASCIFLLSSRSFRLRSPRSVAALTKCNIPCPAALATDLLRLGIVAASPSVPLCVHISSYISLVR